MNLAETQANIKKGLIVVAALTFTYYFGRFLIVQGINLYRIINPQELPPPEARFKELPQLKMTKVQVDGNVEYILDTQNGGLPRFKDRIEVYPIPKPLPTLLSEQKIKQLATDLQFVGDSSKLTSSLFRWVDGANSRTFQADAVSKNFKLDTPLFKISSIVNNIPAITASDATESVEGFLRSKLLLSPTDLENVTFTALPTQVTLGQIREAGSATTNAKIMKVDAYIEIPTKTDPDSTEEVRYKILGPNPKDSLISFLVTNSESNTFKYPIVNFTYWTVDYENGSEYYLTPISEVWAAIQNGKGITSYVKMRNQDYFIPTQRITANKIEIRDVYLAYYMQSEYDMETREEGYLQPIYVFEGQITSGSDIGDVVIYFPAVRGDFTASE